MHSLDALNPTAYAAFQVSQDLKDVVERSVSNSGGGSAKPGMTKSLSIRLSLMTPVKPMLVGTVELIIACCIVLALRPKLVVLLPWR